MRERNPTTQVMKASEARDQWATVLNQVYRQEKRVLVEKSGIPVAAIVSADDYQRLAQLEQERNERFTALDRSWEAFAGLTDDDATVEREVAAAVVAARLKRRQEPRAANTV